MTGRGLAVVAGLGADLQPAGWRLTDAPGIDHRRARSLLAQDRDHGVGVALVSASTRSVDGAAARLLVEADTA